jgi:uncharacterized protein YraI
LDLLNEGGNEIMKLLLPQIAAGLLVSVAFPASAQVAEVTVDLNMRIGPGTRYPVIATIPEGRDVRIYSCIRGLDWCDIGWRNTRGWVFSDFLRYQYAGEWRPLPDWGVQIDLPIVTFSLGEYADRYYRRAPFYNDLRRWARDRDNVRFNFRNDDDDDNWYRRTWRRNRQDGTWDWWYSQSDDTWARQGLDDDRVERGADFDDEQSRGRNRRGDDARPDSDRDFGETEDEERRRRYFD